jgi:hypothetical protein
VAQVVVCLPSKCETLSSNPSTIKNIYILLMVLLTIQEKVLVGNTILKYSKMVGSV